MQLYNTLRKGLTNLPLVAGALLIVGTIVNANLEGFDVSCVTSPDQWSTLVEGMPILGGPSSSAPEIDPGSARNAIALLVGGMLMLVGLRRRRAEPSMPTSEDPKAG
jgi:hypothetical protein